MTEYITSPERKSADNPSVSLLTRNKHPITGALATTIQWHQAGISLGVVGLLVGALTANPLIAIAGLIGGITAGAFVDRNKIPTDPAGRDPQMTPDNPRPASDTSPATLVASAASVVADPDCGPGFRDAESPVAPGPLGGVKRAVRKMR